MCPHWRLMRPLLQAASSFQRRSPFVLLPNGSWKGSTANSQIATAGELEQFDWWSERVRKSFCTHQKGAGSACPPGASASQALLHCPRLNKLHFMVGLNPSSSFHGTQKKKKKKKSLKIWPGYLQIVLCAGSSLSYQLVLVLPAASRGSSPSAPQSSCSVGAAVVHGNCGTRAGKRISCAGIIQTWFSLVLLLAQRAASTGQALWVKNPCLTLVPGLP